MKRTEAEEERRNNAASGIIIAVVLAITGLIWLVKEPLRIWHVTGADGQLHPDGATWAAYGISGGLIMAVLMAASINSARKRELARPRPAPPSVAEALRIADFPEPLPALPACWHLDAEPLVNAASTAPVGWWCGDCGEGFGPEFGDTPRACCDTKPAQEGHAGWCPRY